MATVDTVSVNVDPYGSHRLIGPEYIVSDQKLQLDISVARLIEPVARVGALATEFVIYGSLSPDHYFMQVRENANGEELVVPKVRTMQEPAPGAELDIDRYSPRIVNRRALLARIIGLDELPQWPLVARGEMSLVGPRPLLRVSKDRFSTLAETGGMATEEVEEWREFLNMARPGIYGKSQAMRHRRNFNEYTPPASVKTIKADLDYKRKASMTTDIKTVLFSTATTLVEGAKSLHVKKSSEGKE